jgi:hypothetical protein
MECSRLENAPPLLDGKPIIVIAERPYLDVIALSLYTDNR